MSTNGGATTSSSENSTSSSSQKQPPVSTYSTAYDNSKYFKNKSGSQPASPVPRSNSPHSADTMRGPQTGSKGLSPSETARLLMGNDSDSDSDNLVIDMGSKPTIDPKIIPLSKKEHFAKNEQPAFTQNNSTSLKGKSRSGSPDTPPAGMKVSSYKVADSKSSKSQNTKSKIENRKCDAFEDVEDAMAAMFAGLEDDSPQKKKRPPSKAEPDVSESSQPSSKSSKLSDEIASETSSTGASKTSNSRTPDHSKNVSSNSRASDKVKKKIGDSAKSEPEQSRQKTSDYDSGISTTPDKTSKKLNSDLSKKSTTPASSASKKKASDSSRSTPSLPTSKKRQSGETPGSHKKKVKDTDKLSPGRPKKRPSTDEGALSSTGKKKGGPKPKPTQQSTSRRNSRDAGSSGSKPLSKKREKELAEQTEQERLLEKLKGPFVRVAGNVESPQFTNVINSPSDALTAAEASKRGAPDFEARVRVTGFGPTAATSSTLSSKYDPRTVDETWVCVFCQKGSHFAGMGDLYGPYYVSPDVFKCGPSSGGSGGGGSRPNSPPFTPVKSSSSSQDLAMKFILGGGDRSSKRKRARQKSSEKTSSDNRVEVWFHEDCVCWCPDVRLVGTLVIGLDEAVKLTQRALCSKCHLRGSTLACVANGCRETAHFNCAKLLGWDVDQEIFQARCAAHSTASKKGTVKFG